MLCLQKVSNNKKKQYVDLMKYYLKNPLKLSSNKKLMKLMKIIELKLKVFKNILIIMGKLYKIIQNNLTV